MVPTAGNVLSESIKKKALDLGFDLCGIAPSRNLGERENILREWCAAGMNSDMSYLAKNIEKRVSPGLLFQGTKSVVVTGLNYYTDNLQDGDCVPVISRYALGSDYHNVISKKLDLLLEFIRSQSPGAEGRVYIDSEALLEKAWAVEAGLGWQGRHSIVINERIGSFFFIGIILLNIELDYDRPIIGSRCGTCRLCIEMCPTRAINENGTIDTRKCIANLTIENRGPIPEDLVPKLGRRVYGCDLCQEVCPWNNRAKSNSTPEFMIKPDLKRLSRDQWLGLTAEWFDKLFGDTPVARRKYEPFMRTVRIVTDNNS
jgi:epoxyqueuosine reductase